MGRERKIHVMRPYPYHIGLQRSETLCGLRSRKHPDVFAEAVEVQDYVMATCQKCHNVAPGHLELVEDFRAIKREKSRYDVLMLEEEDEAPDTE